MKRSGDNTHPCLRPTPTVNGCDLTPPTWTQTSEQEYSDLTANCGWSIIPISQSFGVFPECHATGHNRVSQRTPSLLKILKILGRISSYTVPCSTFSVLTPRKTSTAMMIFPSPDCTSCASDGMILARFKIFEILSPFVKDVTSSWSGTSFWSLMDPAKLHLLPRRHQIVCKDKTILLPFE